MDPRVKPEDDEGGNVLQPGPDTVANKRLNTLVILGLDPRIHA